MNNKLHETLNKSKDALEEVKGKLIKGLADFGSAIGGGTTESPTIQPTSDTSQAVRDNTSNDSSGSWFGLSEEMSFSKNGQWDIKEIDKCANKEA